MDEPFDDRQVQQSRPARSTAEDPGTLTMELGEMSSESVAPREMVVPLADIILPQRTLQSFVQSVALLRSIPASNGLQNIGRVARGAAFHRAVIDWCVLFGSDNQKHQHLHWKNVFSVEEFRTGLIDAVALSEHDCLR